MWKAEKWVESAISALIGSAIVTTFTGLWEVFLFTWVFSTILSGITAHFLLEKKENLRQENVDERTKSNPFIVSEYYDRMEKVSLDIQAEKKPIERTIILWLGLDGLRINEDGSSEWISRKKPEQKPPAYLAPLMPMWQMEQASGPIYGAENLFQSSQEQINELRMENVALQMQAAQSAQNMAISSAFQNFVGPYPRYIGGWEGQGYGSGILLYYSQMTNCCN